MSFERIQIFLESNPEYGWLLVFLFGFLESMIITGSFMPSAILFSLCIYLYNIELYNHEIKNLDKATLTKNEFIFHAGTKIDGDKVLSNGGRVLNFVAKSENFKTSREMTINLIKKINWENGFYRKDIGFKVIDE